MESIFVPFAPIYNGFRDTMFINIQSKPNPLIVLHLTSNSQLGQPVVRQLTSFCIVFYSISLLKSLDNFFNLPLLPTVIPRSGSECSDYSPREYQLLGTSSEGNCFTNPWPQTGKASFSQRAFQTFITILLIKNRNTHICPHSLKLLMNRSYFQ